MEYSQILRELLSRRDPHGYYVIPASYEALNYINGFQGVKIVSAGGDLLLIKTRSRNTALKIARMLMRRNLIEMEEVE
ncbi:MAG: hypothetical protein GSR85_05795 [Desulfurococcales archaeon]|nr:hypothetical protein [Desulfurococcales archaeon]